MLDYAHGEILDAIGEFKDCQRLEASKARCTLQFSTNAKRAELIEIPAGTRATPDGNIIFKTLDKCVIAAGTLSTTVEAECTIGGATANGVPVGAITTMIDNVPGVTGVTNTSATNGGDDGEPYPYDADAHPDGDDGAGDNRYRERIRIANAAYSTAGSENGYIYWAKTASADITDVKVMNDLAAGTIELVVMTKDGTPSADILEKVKEICSAKDVRPMNDIVTVSAPQLSTDDIEIEYTIMDGDQSQALVDITGEGGAIDRFTEYTAARLGRDINPDLLHTEIMLNSEGKRGVVYSCKVIKPEATVLTDRQLAHWSGNITLHEPQLRFEE
jgi:phage-related baseplate assembly protein